VVCESSHKVQCRIVPVNHPYIVLPRLLLLAPLFAVLCGILAICRVRKDEVRRIEEIAHARGPVRDQGEDLGDEGLLDERGERGVELGQAGFACSVSLEYG